MYSFIDTNEWCLESIRELKPNGIYALDIETTGTDPFLDQILLIQVAEKNGNINIYDSRKIDRHILATYLDHLLQLAGTIILHNAKFDIKFLSRNYFVVPRKNILYDTMLAEWILNNGIDNSTFYSLKDLVKKYHGLEIEKDTRLEFVGYDKDYFTNEQLEYAAKDVELLFNIAEIQIHYLSRNDLLRTAEIEFNDIPATVQMELTGVKLDVTAWLNLYKDNIELGNQKLVELQDMVNDIKCEFYSKRYNKTREYDFSQKRLNPNSSEEVLAILKYRGAKLERRTFNKKTKKEEILYEDVDTTDAKVLEKLNDEVAKAIIEYRKVRKLSGTYGDSFLKHIHPVTGRIHSNFHQNGTYSGRRSSSDPNMQNIPVRGEIPVFRYCFVEDDPYVQITADYSQIEMRIAAELSGDKILIKAFFDGTDLHALTASLLYQIPIEQVTKQQRANGKKFNFSVLYGASAFKVSTDLEIPIQQAEILVNNWRAGFPELAKFLDETADFLKENGYVKTQSGRRRYFVFPNPNDKDYHKTINRFIREGCNHPIQGTSADITKIAETEIYYRILDYDAHLMRAVHDEISVRCHKDIAEAIERIMISEMTKAAKLFIESVPVKVDSQISREWGH